jgi:hypothetical protein
MLGRQLLPKSSKPKASHSPSRNEIVPKAARYNALFGAEKENIGPENAYPWNVKP